MADWKQEKFIGATNHKEVMIWTKGGIGILSLKEGEYMLLFTDTKAAILSQEQGLINMTLDHAKLLVEYMLSHISDWSGMGNWNLEKRKKAARVIIDLRQGGSFWFYLNGVRMQLVLNWDNPADLMSGGTEKESSLSYKEAISKVENYDINPK